MTSDPLSQIIAALTAAAREAYALGKADGAREALARVVAAAQSPELPLGAPRPRGFLRTVQVDKTERRPSGAVKRQVLEFLAHVGEARESAIGEALPDVGRSSRYMALRNAASAGLVVKNNDGTWGITGKGVEELQAMTERGQ